MPVLLASSQTPRFLPYPQLFLRQVQAPCRPCPHRSHLQSSKAEAPFLQEALLALWADQTGSRPRLPKPSQAGDCGWGPLALAGLHKEPRSLGRGGVHLHCAACSRGHRRCTQGPRWRSGAIRWWLSSDNLHNRCPLSWQQTRRGGVASAGPLPRPTLTSSRALSATPSLTA